VNPKSTSNQSSKPCTVLQYPSRIHVHIYVVMNQSSPHPISPFLSLSLLSSPPYIRTPNQLAYIQACIVYVYVCVHIGVHCWQAGVSLQGSNIHGNPSHGSIACVYCFLALRPRESSRTGLPFVGVYTCMYIRMYIHGCICMRVCGYRLSVNKQKSRVSRGEKRGTG